MRQSIQISLFFLFKFSLLFSQAGKKEYSVFLGDTINVVDNIGLKQGRWVYFGKDQKGVKNKVFKYNQITQDGFYFNDEKNGLWKSYHINTNKIKSEITYANGVINGKARFYTEKGKLYQEGFLKNNKWIGTYFLFNEKGEKFTRQAWVNDVPKNAFLELKGLITRNGKPVEDVEVEVEWNDLSVSKIKSDLQGSFTLYLDLQQEYVVFFSKKGLHKQSLLVNTFIEYFSDTSIYKLHDWKVQLNDNAAAAATNDIIGFIINKPSNKIYYNKRKKAFDADGSYEHLFKKQLNDISKTSKLIVASTMETNKKLEIENLRIQAEAKLKEIELLKHQQELQQIKLKEKETELIAKKLESDKKEQELALLEKEKRINDLLFKEKENQILQEQLETEKKTHEIDRLSALTRQQQLDWLMQQQQLADANSKAEKEKMLAEMTAKELKIATREKEMHEIELKEQIVYVNFLLFGLLIVGVFSFFLIRNIRLKKKANSLLAQQTLEIKNQKFEIEEKSKLLEEKNLETTQSILYAKRIQYAILPPDDEIKPFIPDYFILYKPKDIVSGDFYFFSAKHAKDLNQIVIASVDCTGHGVPGAFMSMIGSEKLKDAVELNVKPGHILRELNRGVKSALRQSTETINTTRDGMDLALCTLPVFNKNADSITINYAGANRPLWIIRKNTNELFEIKATKSSIGGLTHDDQVFTDHSIELKKGDTFYLFTDGYADQFGGENSKKLMTKNFKEILLNIYKLNLDEQKQYLETFFENWKGTNEQVDDILVIGIRV